MTYKQICDAVKMVKRKYGESDPVRLCHAMGILLLYVPMGNSTTSIKGYFTTSHRIRAITINSDLPEVIQRIIIAHEIGHAVLHANCGICAFHEVTLFDQTSELEKDANLFAAEYLLEDGVVMEALNQDVTFFGAAALLYVPVEFMDFKFRIMKWRGYQLRESPITATSTFLRDMEVPGNVDYQ